MTYCIIIMAAFVSLS